MAIKQQAERDAEEVARQRQRAILSQHVLNALGHPGDLNRVEVRRLWRDHYRVNVLVGMENASARIAHSYFLVLGPDGIVVASTPAITRRY